jgi:hypothetical protein
MLGTNFDFNFRLHTPTISVGIRFSTSAFSNLHLSDVLSVLSDLTFLDPSLRYRFVTQMNECDTCYPCFDSLGAWELGNSGADGNLERLAPGRAVSRRNDTSHERHSRGHLVKSLLVVLEREDVGAGSKVSTGLSLFPQSPCTHTMPLVLILPLSRRSMARGKQ